MRVIESLPNLIELTGLNPADQSNVKYMTSLFNSCGKSLQILEVTIRG